MKPVAAPKGSVFTKELVPLRVPYLVREGWGFCALCFILFFPLAGVLIVTLSRMHTFWAIPVEVDVLLLFALFVTCFAGPFWLVGSLTSKFIAGTVRHHIEEGKPELGERLALLVNYQVWFREYRRNEWFRRFLQERNLYEKSARYRKFLAKLRH
jgi:hypothetical protein